MAKAARRARLAEQGATTAAVGTAPHRNRRAGTAEHWELNEDDAPTPIEKPAGRSAPTGAEPSIASPATDIRSPRRRVRSKGLEDVLRVCVLVTAGLVVVLGALALGFGLSGGRDAVPGARHAVVVPRSNSPKAKSPGARGQGSIRRPHRRRTPQRPARCRFSPPSHPTPAMQARSSRWTGRISSALTRTFRRRSADSLPTSAVRLRHCA